jgi:UDP-N-acetyl-D-galactosamine dehydrogenase
MGGSLPRLEAARIAVVGLGYVGLPLAAAFARRYDTLGFDIDGARVAALRKGHDATGELDADELAALSGARLSDDPAELRGRDLFVVAVPTPVTRHKWPDLAALLAASRTVGAAMAPGAVVVFESTVYPGATEEVCVPELERASGLRCNHDFHVGYSPERVNPGDREHRLQTIVKVTSGSTEAAAELVDALYASIVPAGTHRAPDIRTAEAAKAIENTQRDVNIALMNELAQMFRRLGLDTQAVLDAAGTKWNFLRFRPGLVGGHCIGVDPYYLIHKAQEAGHFPELITASRRINDGMAAYVTARLLRLLAAHRIGVAGARVLVLGATFKENCPDLRNSQVVPIVQELRECHAEVDVHDPWADPEQCTHELGLVPLAQPQDGRYDAVLLAVAHREFVEAGPALRDWLRPGGVMFDVRHALPRELSDERL